MSKLTRSVAITFSFVYCLAFFVRLPPSWFDGLPAGWSESIRWWVNGSGLWLFAQLRTLLTRFRGAPGPPELAAVVYLLIVGVGVPWLILTLIGRGRPAVFGTRLPNRLGWRMLAVGYIVALPFLFWMASRSAFARGYVRQEERIGQTAFLVYYFFNMLAEHMLLHGFILAMCQPLLRWPQFSPVVLQYTGSKLRQVFQWLGLAQSTQGTRGLRSVIRWLGVPQACVLGIVVSGVLFSLVHVGKDNRELLLSFPGGLASAYIAYRTNSWLTPFLLHLTTAGTAYLILKAV